MILIQSWIRDPARFTFLRDDRPTFSGSLAFEDFYLFNGFSRLFPNLQDVRSTVMRIKTVKLKEP